LDAQFDLLEGVLSAAGFVVRPTAEFEGDDALAARGGGAPALHTGPRIASILDSKR